MERALNEIGKLRNEMRVGFIEIENQIKANTENTINKLASLENQMQKNMVKTVETFSKFSNTMENGFIAVEQAIEEDLSSIN